MLNADPHLLLGEEVPGYLNRGPYTVTAQDIADVRAIRAILIPVARNIETITYQRLGELTGLNHRRMGRPLDLLSLDCERRGEPSLAVLVVRKDTGRAGWGLDLGADDDVHRHIVELESRADCWRFWREP